MFIESHDEVLNLSKFHGWGWNTEEVDSDLALLYLFDDQLGRITLESNAPFAIDANKIEVVNYRLLQGVTVKCEDYLTIYK